MIFRLIFILIFLSCSGPSSRPPQAVKGILNLSDWNFDSSSGGTVRLEGEWEFYRSELIDPDSGSELNVQNRIFVGVPGAWNSFQTEGKPAAAKGYGTYRLKVLLNRRIQELSLRTDHIGTACRIWINGKLLAAAGKVSKDEQSAEPGYLIRPFHLSMPLNELDIIIHVSNYHDRKGGIWRPVIIGTNDKIAEISLFNHFLNFFLFGSLLLIGIYHLGIYSLRRQDLSALWFGLFSILISGRPLFVGESVMYAIFPDRWTVLNKAEYLTVYAGLPLFINFIKSIYPDEMNDSFKKCADVFGILFCSAVILLPSYWYTHSLTFFQILLVSSLFYFFIVLIKAARNRRTGAGIFLSGSVFICAALLNDILYSELIISTAPLFPFGFLIFVGSQAFVLSIRFSMAFSEAEDLSDSLQKFNQNLESKIADGIKEQEKYSQCLLELSKSRTIEFSGLESALKEVTETCVKILEIERCSIWVFNSAGDEIQCLDLFLAKTNVHKKGQVIRKEDFPAYFKMIKECSVISAPDAYAHPAARDLAEKYSEPHNICSMLDAPIRSGGKLIGILCCEQDYVHKYWSQQEENFAAALGNILAGYFDWHDLQGAFSELRETKQEIEDLNQFAYLVNSLPELDDVFGEVCKYVYIKYDIANTWLFLPDETGRNLYSYKAYSYDEIFDEKYDTLLNKKFPISRKEISMLNLIFRRKKPFYINRMQKFNSELDREFTEMLSLKSFLYLPLIRKDQCVGIFAFGCADRRMNISKAEIRKLSSICSQIAGSVEAKHLLQLLEKAKTETEKLNRLIKSLNEDLDIRNIMSKVLRFVNENFGIKFFALYTVNPEKTSISLLDIDFPDYISEEDRKKISHFRIPIGSRKGAHSYACRSKKPLYLPEITVYEGAKEELFIINKFKIKSILLMPLLLNNEIIGILDFSDSDTMNLSQEDILKISILSEQLAGIIYGSHLFKAAEDAKVQAEIERGIAFIAQREAELERAKSEKLLLNILPEKIADELKEKGSVEPVYYENATILFTDFKGFTQIAEKLSPPELLRELDICFSIFDQIIERNRLEKLKTIGDGYMCAGGIPKLNKTHAADCCISALAIQSHIKQMKEFSEASGTALWELRIGIHSGPVIAGVIGERKFAYDVWGDTVNTASRMESSGTPGKINVSGSTYEQTKDLFDFEYRGKVKAKNKGQVDMYYLTGIKPEFSINRDGKTPNEKFWEYYSSPAV